MRIPFDVGEGVVLSVHRDPFFWLDASRDPEEEAKDQSDWLPHGQSPMAKSSVEVHRGAHACHLSDQHTNDEGEQDGLKNCHEGIVTHYLLVGRQFA